MIFCAIALMFLSGNFGSHAFAADTPKTDVTKASPAQPVTLEAVVADVLANNPELSFYESEIGAARGEARSAAAWLNPEFAATVGDKRVTGGGPAAEGVAWSVSVRQAFEWPGRIPLRKAIANQQIQLAELGLAQFKAALVARARSAAYGFLAAQQKSAAAREVADRFNALRQVLVQREPAGITPELELRIIEATTIMLLRKASDASLAEQGALLELNQLRGQPWQESLQIAHVALAFSAVPVAETLLQAGRANNFEIRMRQAELEQQGFKVSVAKHERYPAVSIAPYFSQEKASDRDRQFGIGISLPLPLWNQNEGNIEAASARQKQAETAMYVTQRNIERQIVEKAQIYRTKVAEMAKWRPEAVAQFRHAAALADRHYRLGAVPITTYVELQKQYLEAVEALLETRREALDASQQLQLLTGMDLNIASINSPATPRAGALAAKP